MQQDQQPRQPGIFGFDRMADTFNMVYCAAAVLEACFSPFLRVGFGMRALAWRGPCAGVVLLAFSEGAPEVLAYAAVWLAAVVLNRIVSFVLESHRFQGFW